MIAYNLVKGKANAVAGGSVEMGRMGTLKLDENMDGAMSDPFVYDASNVDEFAKIF